MGRELLHLLLFQTACSGVCAGAAVEQGALPAWGSHAPRSQTGAGAVCWDAGFAGDASFIGGAGLSGMQVLPGTQAFQRCRSCWCRSVAPEEGSSLGSPSLFMQMSCQWALIFKELDKQSGRRRRHLCVCVYE